jgi:hypothetical protein
MANESYRLEILFSLWPALFSLCLILLSLCPALVSLRPVLISWALRPRWNSKGWRIPPRLGPARVSGLRMMDAAQSCGHRREVFDPKVAPGPPAGSFALEPVEKKAPRREGQARGKSRAVGLGGQNSRRATSVTLLPHAASRQSTKMRSRSALLAPAGTPADGRRIDQQSKTRRRRAFDCWSIPGRAADHGTKGPRISSPLRC